MSKTQNFVAYYCAWSDGKDASVYVAKKGYKVVVENMKTDTVIQTKEFKGRYADHAAKQFAAFTLGLMDEVRSLREYETSCREYAAKIIADLTIEAATVEGEDTEYGRNVRAALKHYKGL